MKAERLQEAMLQEKSERHEKINHLLLLLFLLLTYLQPMKVQLFTQVDTHTQFHVHLSQILQQIESVVPQTGSHSSVGKYCHALFKLDGKYHRGVIISVDQSNTCHKLVPIS